MRTALTLVTALLMMLAPRLARAWDAPDLWFDDATAKMPGGGGLLGTGSQRDHGVTCAHCHVESAGKIDAKIDFNPPLADVGGQSGYAPGTTYQVTAHLVGQHLGKGFNNCDQYVTDTNNFAATFEDQSGVAAGSLASDSGQTSASCAPMPPMISTGTTFLAGDCRTIVSLSGGNFQGLTDWSFTWTAPPAGTGQIGLFYGLVDGNCDMMSMGDDVKVGQLPIVEAPSANAKAQGKSASNHESTPPLWGLFPVVAALAFARRRRSVS